jgi:hypothetical protein
MDRAVRTKLTTEPETDSARDCMCQAVLSSSPATFALLRDIKRKRSMNGSWYEDRSVCPCVPHCVSVIDICQARRYLRKSTTTKGHIYLRAPDSEDTGNIIVYQCRAVVVRCPE